MARCVAHSARRVRNLSIDSAPSFWKLDQAPPYWKEFAQHLVSFNAYRFLISETKGLVLTTNVLKSNLKHMEHLYDKRGEFYCICVAEDVEKVYKSYTGPGGPPDDDELRDSYMSVARYRVGQVLDSVAYIPRCWLEFGSPAESGWSMGKDGYLSPEEY